MSGVCLCVVQYCEFGECTFELEREYDTEEDMKIHMSSCQFRNEVDTNKMNRDEKIAHVNRVVINSTEQQNIRAASIRAFKHTCIAHSSNT